MRNKDWGFKDDPTLVSGGPGKLRGAPPDGSVFQCHGRVNGSNPPRRCRKWAFKNGRYCKFHGGRNPLGTKTRIDRDVAIYSRIAGPILSEKLAQLAELEPGERHSLQEEIDVARVMCERAVKLYDAAFFGAKEASLDARMSAQRMLKSSIDFVGQLVVKASRAKMVDQSTVDVEQLGFIVKQVTHIIEEEIADYDRAMADRVVERLRGIRMPERGGAGAMTREDMAAALRGGASAIMGGIEAEESE